MSLKDQNIEELFRSGLEDAEMPVNEQMWSNISSNMGATSGSASAAGGASKLLTYLGLSGAACAVGVTATVIFSNMETDTQASNSSIETTTEETINDNLDNTEVMISDNQGITEDEAIVEKIILQTDPNTTEASDETTKKESNTDSEPSISIVKVQEEPTHDYGGSWINDFLTPKTEPYTEPDVNTAIETNQNTDASVASVTPVIEIVEQDQIIASIVAMPVGGYAPLEVSFAHLTEKGNVTWNFGDGATSYDHSVSHTFEKPGTYTVELTIVDGEGRDFKDFKEIEVKENSSLTNLPNIFTPNNDGDNDYFKLEGKNIEDFKMIILDPSQNIVFESNDINDGWNGKNLYGEDAPIGNYIYVVSMTGIDGKKYEHTHVLKLMR